MQIFNTSDGPDHRHQLRESVSTFVSRHAKPEQLRSTLREGGAVDKTRWQEAADSGWLALLVPEEHDGIGLEPADLSALHQEVGRASLRDPLAEVALLVIETLLAGENRELAGKVLPELVGGQRLATLAWAATAQSFDSRDVGPTASLQEGNWQLSGQADCVPFAQVGAGVVAARTTDGVALFWLDRLPVPAASAAQADGTRLSRLSFDGVMIAQDLIIAPPSQGAAILDRCLSLLRFAYAAQLLGATETVFSMTVEYLKTRNQFGQSLGSFQALQHRLVDLFVQIEVARSSLIRAENADRTTFGQNASAAKARISEVGRRVAREAIQLHGAIGYTQEYDLSLYVNRILTLSAQLGSARAHRSEWFAKQFPHLEARA